MGLNVRGGPGSRAKRIDWRGQVKEALEREAAILGGAKQERSRQRTAEILAAAIRVFARDGIARAKMSDIAAEAGVPLASCYDYFRNKEDLAFQLQMRRYAEFFCEFKAAMDSLPTCRTLLHHFLWLTTDFVRRNPDWARILYLEIWPSVSVAEERVGRAIDDYGRVVVGLIEEGAERGEWQKPVNAYHLATILIGGVTQLSVTWLLYRKPKDIRTAADQVIGHMLKLVDIPQPLLETTVPVSSLSRKAKIRV